MRQRDGVHGQVGQDGKIGRMARSSTAMKSSGYGRPSSLVAITPSMKVRSAGGPTRASGAVRFSMPALASRPGRP
ncbi:hypothetical protein NX786_31740 [Telluria mixta]|uniref:Uncharacterized protein n=1 Tax=Telluria mixta TaxID=34071 RepID=A0ABT2C9T2_9BURK|nr:hypothetical protein [Telluria mixta]MCS0633917.1 hypothetical protein [Telluria mixta]WEM99474.1 hypothetical protein P0M04_29335 [Telluria mixta]